MADRSRGGKDELSRSLLQLRETSELSTRQAGRIAGFSQSKVNRIEKGINVPTEDDVNALLDAYGVQDEQQRTHLTGLARDIRAEHRPVVMARGKGRPDVFQSRLARIEDASAHIRSYAPTAVTGVLQTETYMRHLIAERELPPADVDAFVAARRTRQNGLGQSDREWTIITTAGALGWRLGTREDMAEQINHIATLVATPPPGVCIGVIPWGTRADRLTLHGWDIYDERAVCYGTSDATAILTEPRDIARYLELHAAIENIAVYDEHAHQVLVDLAAAYRD